MYREDGMCRTGKAWGILLLAMTLATVVGCGTSGDGGTPTIPATPTSTAELSLNPEDVVRSYLAAWAAQDVDGVAACFTEDQRAQIRAEMANNFGDINEIEIANLQIDRVSESANEATVQVNYDWELVTSGEQYSGHERELVDLVKTDGRWLVETVTVIPGETQPPESYEEYETEMDVMQLAVSVYIMDSGQAPTADGQLPREGERALIDFDACYINGDGESFCLIPWYVLEAPKHWDEQVWYIDHNGSVSVDIEPSEY